MRILHIIAGTDLGGAAKGAITLHQGLLDIGFESRVLVQDGTQNVQKSIWVLNNNIIGKASRKIINLQNKLKLLPYGNNLGQFSPANFGQGFIHYDLFEWADIIHLHWVNSGLIKLDELSKIKKPIVWTVRDMWPFTGGCHYALMCKNYLDQCGKCPKLKSSNPGDLSHESLLKKIEVYQGLNIHFVGISEWVTKELRESTIFQQGGGSITTIENCIDTELFFPSDKIEAREILGLPVNKNIVLSGAINNRSEYKGGEVLSKLLSDLAKLEEIAPVVFGSGGDDNASVIYTGFIRDEKMLRLYYVAADVFVAPSIQEAFGKTIAESMACGTPVVCFDYSGPGTIVNDSSTGMKAVPYSVGDLRDKIMILLNLSDEEKHHMKERCIKDASSRFSSSVAATKYSLLYNQLMMT